MDIVHERCAGLDLHKRTVVAAARWPDSEGGRTERVRTFPTFDGGLTQLAEWLASLDVTHVVMEATGIYWRPVWYRLEDAGFEQMLVNARHVKIVPGRKTDVNDAQWLAHLLECGLLRGSFVPPPAIRELRDLTRYRTRKIQALTQEHQRIDKVLEDAGIKLSAVASNHMGVSGRAMIAALCAGERDPQVLAELARGRLRDKHDQLTKALVGRFGEHHARQLRTMLGVVDDLEEVIGRLDAQVDTAMEPFACQRELLCTIPGVARRTAEVMIAEIGPDMSVFPTAGHLASWAGLCPGANESGGKRRSARTRKADPWLRRALIQSAWAAARTRSRLGSRFWGIARRRGDKKAAVAVAHTIIVIAWHLLTNNTSYDDLGPDYYTRRVDPERETRRLVTRLEALGHSVELTPTT